MKHEIKQVWVIIITIRFEREKGDNMNIKAALKKEGITNIRQLDILSINQLAKDISHKLYQHFCEHNINESDLFISISRLQMYYAQMPEDSSVAKYFYKNQSIYFNDKFSIDEIEEFATHECIHYLQEIKDEKNNLVRLGLYEVAEGADRGMALNEAAVQLMAAKANDVSVDKVKYYDVFLATESPEYYPLECALVKEMMYFTGEYPLYHSTLYSDDVFKNTFSAKFGKRAYFKIERNVNEILNLEGLFNNLTNELKETNRPRKAKQINLLMDQCKEKIANIFIETQDFMIEMGFGYEFDEIRTMNDLKNFKTRIYNFKDLIGYTADYDFYNKYYIKKMEALAAKKEYIEKNGAIKKNENQENLALVEQKPKKVSVFKRVLMKLGILVDMNEADKAWQKEEHK